MPTRFMVESITCPFCDHIFESSQEYDNDDGEVIECENCPERFRLEVYHVTQYSTIVDCTAAGRDHVWLGPRRNVIDSKRYKGYMYFLDCRDCEIGATLLVSHETGLITKRAYQH